MASRNYPVTTRELIEMLEKWKPDQEFNVLVQNNHEEGEPNPIVILEQNTNTIRLN